MALTTAGINFLAQATIGKGIAFTNETARLGVGNSNAAFNESQTDLLGNNKLRKAMDVGYPSIDQSVVTFRSTFLPNEANFPWNEWGLFNSNTGGVMLNRVVESNGTKQSNQTWVLEVAINFTVG